MKLRRLKSTPVWVAIIGLAFAVAALVGDGGASAQTPGFVPVEILVDEEAADPPGFQIRIKSEIEFVIKETTLVLDSVVTLDTVTPSGLFHYGSVTLEPVIRRTERPPLRAGAATGDLRGDNDNWVSISCYNGMAFDMGPFESFAPAISSFGFGLTICANGDILGGWTPPAEVVTREALEENLTAFLAALPEPLTIADLRPPPTSEDREYTYFEPFPFEFRIWKRVEEPHNVYISVRPMGGVWQFLRLDRVNLLEIPTRAKAANE